MKIVEQIKQPILKEMELFESRFKEAMFSNVPIVNRITQFIVRRKGKQMRPMFIFLVAKMVSNGGFKEKTYRGASLIELIHTASLVHDDIVDDSNRRRGFFSLNALWKNKIAVLFGDYLFSKCILLSCENEDFDLLKMISTSLKDMAEGELLQIEKARKLDITETIYFDIIRQKTATLIASCTGIGAASVGAKQDEIDLLRKFGELIGIAFQIKDDLFDYTDAKIGKPTGIDIKEKKMTLPLIYTLNNCDKKEKKWLINSVKNHNKDKKRVKEVIRFVTNNGGIAYTISKMKEYQESALIILSKYPESVYKEALIKMVNYVIERKI
ncbi:MAG: polyprenyl synthetase family protein [Flavobacteriaceae bacterium]|nr:polyprenyl synthetase family protein [Flavobacteriaceae bacterium]